MRTAPLGLLLTVLVCLLGASSAAQQGVAGWQIDTFDRPTVLASQEQLRVRPSFTAVDAVSRGRGVVLLPLPTGRTAALRLDLREEFEDGYVASGPLTDGAGSGAISVVGSVMAARLVVDGQLWMLRQDNAGHLLSAVDEASFAPDGEPLSPDMAAPDGTDTTLHEPMMAQDASTVDLLVVYTPAAHARYPSTSALTADMYLAVANGNTSLANAGVAHQFRLVHLAPVSYTESGSSSTDLSRLRGTSDGFMDEVHALRDSVAADLVVLVTHATDVCGVAYVMTNNSSSFGPFAFSVVVAGCASANLTLAHEVGHNMGLHHNVEDAGNCGTPELPRPCQGVTSYAYGHRVPGAGRTVMAYACPTSGPSCARAQVFSTPSASFSGGTPAGVADAADNARALNLTFATVAAFRAGTSSCTSSLSLAGAPASFVYTGGSGTVTVTFASSCGDGWTMTSDQPWLTFASATTGTVSGSVAFAVSANTGASPSVRMATVTATSAGTSATFVVTQHPPTLSVSPDHVLFRVVRNGAGTITAATPEQEAPLTWSGPAVPMWTATVVPTAGCNHTSWLQVTPSSGTGAATLRLAVDVTALGGVTSACAAVQVTAAGYATTLVPVAVASLTMETSAAPIGHVDTPVDGAAGVTGSIAVSGWAVDDVGVDRVDIHRLSVPSDPAAAIQAGGLVYLGRAIFVTGARPDVQAAFGAGPSVAYPNAQRGGWGLLMLTNALPNQTTGQSTGGQGTFTLVVVAVDLEGRSSELGRRTITVTNDTATVPFGAIDTPAQGGGVPDRMAPYDNVSAYPVFGWALSPGGACIATDGSTIDVLVDGVVVGHPIYNLNRADIAGGYPGYCNSNGAVGVYYLDASALSDGLHTLVWRVRDVLGRTAEIGSRYFRVSRGSVTGTITP